jgi:hypothetical protein
MNPSEAWTLNTERAELIKRVTYEPTYGPASERWSAIDPSMYTGPTDPVGTGKTKEDALADLLEQLDW